MRDEIEGRIWADNQKGFAEGVDRHLALMRSALARLGAWDGSTAQLVSLIGAFALTALTVKSTAL